MDVPSVPLHEVLEAQHATLLAELRDIKEYQRVQNGRVATAETAIAVLIERVSAAEKHGTRGLLAGVLSGIGLVGAAVWKVLDR